MPLLYVQSGLMSRSKDMPCLLLLEPSELSVNYYWYFCPWEMVMINWFPSFPEFYPEMARVYCSSNLYVLKISQVDLDPFNRSGVVLGASEPYFEKHSAGELLKSISDEHSRVLHLCLPAMTSRPWMLIGQRGSLYWKAGSYKQRSTW